MKRLWREPLLHFLFIGAVLFLLYEAGQEGDDPEPGRIVVTAAQVEQLSARFRRTWLRPPTQAELDALIESHVQDEVFYREAVAMGLDRDDPQVRRRMRLKLEFLLEDPGSEAPDDAQLQAFLKQHPERFRMPPRVSLQQLYLDPSRHDDPVAAARALLAELDAAASPEARGDATLLPAGFTLATPEEIARAFGEAFAGQVAGMTPGDWAGPVYSEFGVHLVRVTGREAERLPALAEIRDRVEREYLAEQRRRQKALAYRTLREGYEVIIEPAGPDREAGTAVAADTGAPAGP